MTLVVPDGVLCRYSLCSMSYETVSAVVTSYVPRLYRVCFLSLQTVFTLLVSSAMLIFWSRPIYDIFFRERVEGRRYIRVGEKPALTPSQSR